MRPASSCWRRSRASCRADVWVVAPELEQSGASHSLTTRRPLRMTEIAPRRYAVDGTPTDCVLLAVKRLLRDRPPTLVLSGINAGGNLGEDMTYSGTVAAAMEATLLGVPAIALSQEYRDRDSVPWGAARPLARKRSADPRRRAAVAERHLLQRQFPGVAAGGGARLCRHPSGQARPWRHATPGRSASTAPT